MNNKVRICRADKGHKVTCTYPGKNGNHCGIVKNCHKPSDKIAVLTADSHLCIVNNTVDLFVFLSKNRKCKNAKKHYNAADNPGKNALKHITCGFLQGTDSA